MESFVERLPLKGSRHTVEWIEVVRKDWAEGITGRLRLILFDADGGPT